MICIHSLCVFMNLAKERMDSLKSSLEASHKLRTLSAKRLLQFISVIRFEIVMETECALPFQTSFPRATVTSDWNNKANSFMFAIH